LARFIDKVRSLPIDPVVRQNRLKDICFAIARLGACATRVKVPEIPILDSHAFKAMEDVVLLNYCLAVGPLAS